MQMRTAALPIRFSLHVNHLWLRVRESLLNLGVRRMIDGPDRSRRLRFIKKHGANGGWALGQVVQMSPPSWIADKP